MKRLVSLPEYIEWRNQTKGGMTAIEVAYTLHIATSSADKPCVLTGILLITDKHKQQVQEGWYSSTVLAALDTTNFRDLCLQAKQDDSSDEVFVDGDRTFISLRTPTFSVVAIEELEDKMYRVYVEGRA